MNNAFLLTGGNEGNRLLFLQQALTNIELFCGQIMQLSSVYETAAWGKTDQPSFLNQVVCIRTQLSPNSLLNAVLHIESQLGRKRSVKNASRTIDIDILLYDQVVLQEPSLVIPHPAMRARRFVLTPLDEIAPDLVHPVLLKTIHELLLACPDPLDVTKFTL